MLILYRMSLYLSTSTFVVTGHFYIKFLFRLLGIRSLKQIQDYVLVTDLTNKVYIKLRVSKNTIDKSVTFKKNY